MRVKDMADRTLPPKKSRPGFDDDGKPEKSIDAEVNGDNKEDSGEESEEEYVNVFATTVVEGKRRHFTPDNNQDLNEWLEENVEEKEGLKLSLSSLYECYVEMCVRKFIKNALDSHDFVKFVKTKFGQGMSIKEDSKLKGRVKVGKISNKPKGERKLHLSKENIKDMFADLECPRDGLTFRRLLKHMIPKHPALRLDLKPKQLLNSLNNGVRNGYIELLRGIGKAGIYRWYDADADKKEENEEEELRKKRKQERLAKKESGKDSGEEKKEQGDPDSENKLDEEKTNKDEGKGKPNKRGRKRKATTNFAEKKKAKGKKKKKPKKPSRIYIVHSDPQKIEETFPLAMTFMAEPKRATFHAINKYIDNNYRVDVTSDKLLKTLNTMEEKGYLEKIRGDGKHGVYQLTLDEFDPTDDDDLIGKIVNAVMASVQPKECSTRSLRSYVVEFYPQFQVAERPHNFKKALERAQRKDMIRQVTGIGMTGSYQLVDNFVPTPVILAGKDSSSDYEGDDSESSSDEGIMSDDGEVDVSKFMDAYTPRPTKRRGKVREVQRSAFNPNQAYIDAELRQIAAKHQSMTTGRKRRKQETKKQEKKKMIRTPKRRYAESSEEEESEEEEEEEEPVRKRGRPSLTKKAPAKKSAPKKTPAKKAKTSARSPRKTTYKEASSDEEENDVVSISDDEVDSNYGSGNEEKYKPRASSSRGGTPRKPAPKEKPKKKAATPKKAPVKKGRTPTKKESSATNTLARKAAAKSKRRR